MFTRSFDFMLPYINRIMGYGLQFKITPTVKRAIQARMAEDASDCDQQTRADQALLLCKFAQETHQELKGQFLLLFPDVEGDPQRQYSKMTFESMSFLIAGRIAQSCTDM